MDVNVALSRLKAGGAWLKVEDGSLKIKGNLTDENINLVKQFKDEIIVIITTEQEDLKDDADRFDRLLETKGYARIYSEVLGEKIIFADTEMAAQQLSDNNDLVIYSMDELTVLCKDKSLTVEGLKRIHEAKKLLGGKVVDWGDNKNGQKKSPQQGL